jgi:hypothetical protein
MPEEAHVVSQWPRADGFQKHKSSVGPNRGALAKIFVPGSNNGNGEQMNRLNFISIRLGVCRGRSWNA